MIVFNPLDSFYKSQVGAVKNNDLIKFRVKANFDSVLFAFKKDGEKKYHYVEMNKFADYFECKVSFTTGLYFYHFKTSTNQYISLDNGVHGFVANEKNDFQLLCYGDDYSVPSWLNGGVIYQIFPDRFYRANQDKKIENGKILREDWGGVPTFLPNENGIVLNNDFFGGDLKGITQKLDYIKSLGVSAIYLNPIFKAYSNHRYDTGNYMQIDGLLGDENDLKELIDKADERDIKIILDGVFNHTGADSIYFNKYGNYDSVGAYQSKNSPYYSWFNFNKFPDKYESWWGIDTLPAVNEKNNDFINFITGKDGVLDHYTKLGISGWRFDVVDELPDDFVKKMRSIIKSANNNAIMIGEVWEDASNKIAYGVRREYFQGKELDSVMNYPLKDAIISFVKDGNAKRLSQVVKEQIDHYPKATLDVLMNILSTHDTFRLISALSNCNLAGKTKLDLSKMLLVDREYDNAKKLLKMASLLQYTLYGAPSLYYGDEIGMQGFTDPLNRGCFTWDKIDDELLSWYRFLGKMRSEYSAFKDGKTEIIFDCAGVFAFTRKAKDCEILIIVNNSLDNVNINYNDKLFNLIDQKEYENVISVGVKSYVVLVKR